MLDHIKENVSQTEGAHAFSWQYLSMKQNPHIKRNAMHAYITYMIYTDMAHEQQQRPDNKALYSNTVISTQQQQQQKYNTAGHYAGLASALPNWLDKNQTLSPQKQQQQSYKLPSSPRQRHDLPPPPTESIIGRPLTDFLFEKKTPNVLPPPNTSYHSPSTSTKPNPPTSHMFYD
ncbi:hypothetical protein BD560DRAFT_385645 [Blakeslea trispora]|nr:hypothetical protein BD560DRAFT_385645 [Blakeslea trispora]